MSKIQDHDPRSRYCTGTPGCRCGGCELTRKAQFIADLEELQETEDEQYGLYDQP
jgi:hypothetical protein